MLRSVTFILLFSFYSVFSYGQFNDPGTKGLTIGVNGLSNLSFTPSVGHAGTLLFKYYTKNDLAYRFLLSLGISNTNTVADNGTGTKTTTTNSSNSFGVGMGFQKSVAKFGKFNLYAGADLIGNTTGGKTDTRTEYYKTVTNGDSLDYKETITNKPTPFTLGVYPLIGISYFFSKNFSVGLEYSVAITYTSPSQGNTIVTQRYFGADLYPVITKTNTGSAFNLSTNGNALINIGFYF